MLSLPCNNKYALRRHAYEGGVEANACRRIAKQRKLPRFSPLAIKLPIRAEEWLKFQSITLIGSVRK